MNSTRVGDTSLVVHETPTSAREADGVLASVRRIPLEVFGIGDLDALDEVLAPDYVDHSFPPGVAPNAASVRNIVTQLRAAMPDLQVTLDIELRDGDFVVHHVHMSGTNTGFAFGVEPTGKHAVWAATQIYRMRGRLVVEHWGVAKLDSLWAQLGLIEVPGAGIVPDGRHTATG
jgi:predicted ester cyclase